MNNFRTIDKLTIQEIRDLCQEAEDKGMDVDWERAELIPRKYQNMSPHQRDFLAREETRQIAYRDEQDQKDNDAGSALEAGF